MRQELWGSKSPSSIPTRNRDANGLSYLIEKMKGQRLYAHVNLTKGERSELADLAGSLL